MPTAGQSDTTPDSPHYYHVECLVPTESKKQLLRQNALDESEYESSGAGNSRTEYSETGCNGAGNPTLSSCSFSRSLTIPIDAASTGSSYSMLDIASFDTSSVDLASVGRQRPRLQIDLTRKKPKQSVSKRARGIYFIEFFVMLFCFIIIVYWLCCI